MVIVYQLTLSKIKRGKKTSPLYSKGEVALCYIMALCGNICDHKMQTSSSCLSTHLKVTENRLAIL